MNTKIIVLSFLFVLGFGTTGYQVLEGWTWFDSLYMTAITVTTVGFTEVHELSHAGRIFTIILIFLGFGVSVVALSHLTSFILKDVLKDFWDNRFRKKDGSKMKDHYIIAGFGEMGKRITDQLLARKEKILVIDENKNELIGDHPSDIVLIEGNASDEECLNNAGIHNAKGLFSVVSSDADNTFICMTARDLNPNLRIVTRTHDRRNAKKMLVAGANKVVSPYQIGANRLALAMIHPAVDSMFEVMEDTERNDFEVAEIIISPDSKLVGQTLESAPIRENDLMVVGIQTAEGNFLFQPQSHTSLSASDHMIVIGPANKVEHFKTQC